MQYVVVHMRTAYRYYTNFIGVTLDGVCFGFIFKILIIIIIIKVLYCIAWVQGTTDLSPPERREIILFNQSMKAFQISTSWQVKRELTQKQAFLMLCGLCYPSWMWVCLILAQHSKRYIMLAHFAIFIKVDTLFFKALISLIYSILHPKDLEMLYGISWFCEWIE